MGLAAATYESHPAAALFPMLSEAELTELAEDIHKNGLLDPIVLHDGMILDGRNRYAGCELANVEPRFVEWDGSGDSPTLYVLSKNLHRRHLTTGQKAAIAVESLPLLREEAQKRMRAGKRDEDPESKSTQGRAREIAAKQVGVASATIYEAEQVKKADPEEFDKVRRGETVLHQSYRKIKGIPDKPKKVTKEERVDRIRELAGQGYNSDQIASEIGVGAEYSRKLARDAAVEIVADRIINNTRRLDVNRIINETVMGAQALVAGLELVDERLSQIHEAKVKEWADSLTDSIASLNRLLRQIRRIG